MGRSGNGPSTGWGGLSYRAKIRRVRRASHNTNDLAQSVVSQTWHQLHRSLDHCRLAGAFESDPLVERFAEIVNDVTLGIGDLVDQPKEAPGGFSDLLGSAEDRVFQLGIGGSV